MRPGSPLLSEALNSGQRHYTMRARLGGKDVTDQVNSWSVDRSLSGGLPDQVALTTGGAAAEARLTLSGDEGQTAAQRYSPWAPRSTADVARPGQSTVVSWGVGGENMQALRGRVRSVDADSRAGTAQVTALDGAEVMRGDAWLPPLVEQNRSLAALATYFSSVPWVLDHAARECGFYSSPPARPNSIFFASLNRGMTPNLGGLTSVENVVAYSSDTSPWTAGPRSPASGQWDAYFVPARRVSSQQDVLLTDWWIKAGPGGVSTQSRVRLQFGTGPNNQTESTATAAIDPAGWRVSLGVAAGAYWYDIPASIRADGPVKISWQLRMRATSDPFESRLWVTTAAGQWSTPVLTGGSPGWGWLMRIWVSATDPMECLNVSRVVGDVAISQPWRRGAEILPEIGARDGTNYGLTALPEFNGSWWDLVSAVADDHRLFVGFDEDGIFRARGREYLAPDDADQPPPDLTVTSRRELSQVTASEESDQVANIIRAQTNIYGLSEPPEDWYQAAATTISAGGYAEFPVPDGERGWDLITPYPFTASGEGVTGQPRVKAYTPTGQLAPIEVELSYGPELKVIVYNRGSTTARLATMSGGNVGSLVVTRRPVQTQETNVAVAEDRASIGRYGRRVLEVSTSPWVQLRFQSLIMARQLLEWTKAPMPLSGDLEILPDPRLQIGDVVRVEDPTGSMVDGLFRVLGVRVEGRGGAVTQRLTVRPLYRPAAPVDAGLVMEPITDPDAAPIITG